MEVSAFCGNIRVPWILSAFFGNIHDPWILSSFCGYICITWIISAFCVNIHVPWILSAFRGNIHVPWILSARILPWLATSPVLDKVHYLQHRTIHCSTVLPTVSTRSPQRVFISVDALRSRGYFHLLMIHLTLRTHIHTLASYLCLRTCR